MESEKQQIIDKITELQKMISKLEKLSLDYQDRLTEMVAKNYKQAGRIKELETLLNGKETN